MIETVLIAIIVLLAGALLFLFFQKKSKGEKPDTSFLILQNQLRESFSMFQNQLQDLRNTMDAKLGLSTKMTSEASRDMQRIIRDVTTELTKVGEGQKQVISLADQLEHLQDILKNPKQRGILGEYYLATLLEKAFQPTQYQLQYKFKDGAMVDAALFVGEKIIPIDSKFSLENYNRIVAEKDPVRREEYEKVFIQDLKNRIEETAKYIRPEEKTTEYAFMFIPADGIYYDLLVNEIGAIKSNTRSLLDYAHYEKKVYIVSPTTFYVTLQAMWHGMKAYRIQESTKEILKNVVFLQRHLLAFNEYLQKLGKNLDITVQTYNTSYKEFRKIDKDVLRITGKTGESEIEPLELSKPEASPES